MHPLILKSVIGLFLILLVTALLLSTKSFLVAIGCSVIAFRGIYELTRLTTKNLWFDFSSLISLSSVGILGLYKVSIFLPFEKFLGCAIVCFTLGVWGVLKLIQEKKAGLLFAHFWVSVPLFCVWVGHCYWTPKMSFPNLFAWNPLCLFICSICAGDTVAMFAGKLSRNKIYLFPRISPQKTLQGTLGYFLGSCLMTIGCCKNLELNIGFGFGLALLAFIFGQAGDLLESALKRTYRVKDVGQVIPGHGGVLDRVDSVLLGLIPCMLYYVLLVKK